MLCSCGLTILMVEFGFTYFFIYLGPFTLHSFMFGFNIRFTRKIGYIQRNGHADDVNAES